MVARILVAGIVGALCCRGALAAQAAPVGDSADAADTSDDYQKAQLALFDAVRTDPSPRIQALAGRLYVDDDETPAALRPKRADVVARATGLAPDDAFVQWMGADTGNYYSSQCGPTRWPEAEVANLVRLEPDNAAALAYAAALAHAKGDQVAVDDALARMASAPRADDHLGDEVAAWRAAFAAHPLPTPFDALPVKGNVSSDEKALFRALGQAGYRVPPAKAALAAACKIGVGERTWSRLATCVDAGILLATKGNSFALRDLGTSMLEAAGATTADLADIARQNAWLKANAANPSQNTAAFGDLAADLASDWSDGRSEIEATAHRLARRSESFAAPAGWDVADGDAPSAEGKAVMDATTAYHASILATLKKSSDVRDQALALSAPANLFGDAGDSSSMPVDGASMHAALSDSAALSALAAEHPDEAFVQWLASSGRSADAAALRRLQELEPDNGAVWMASLARADADVPSLLRRMAESTRFDDHQHERLSLWLKAARQQHAGDALRANAERVLPGGQGISDDDFATSFAYMMSSLSIPDGLGDLSKACAANASDRSACVAAARLMLEKGTSVLVANIGRARLVALDALAPDERTRARRIAWWHSQHVASLSMTDAAAGTALVEDQISAGNEIEAMRLAATRRGKAEPPADWKAPFEIEAAKAARAGTAREDR